MDLDLNILSRVNPQAESITLWDNTGVGPAFPYGWQPSAGGSNTQNPKKSDVTSIVLRMIWDNGLDVSHTLSAPERTLYLDPTQGFTILSTDMIGPDFKNFPDGIVTIDITISGSVISGQSQPQAGWTTHMIMPEVFLTFLQNKIRNWVISIPTKVKSSYQVFDPTIANLILDSIYYNVQFFQIERAQKAFDFLSGLLHLANAYQIL